MTINRKYKLRRRIGQWYIERWVDERLEKTEGPFSWDEADSRARILHQAGYDKEQ